MRNELRADLIRDEGVRLKPYACTAGKQTIGIGRNLEDVGITTKEAHQLLDNDIDRVFLELDRNLPWWKTRTDPAQRAMANMAFQLGISGLLAFKKMLACLQAGDYEGARTHALDSKWAKSDTPARAERVAALFVEKEP